ncbi:mitotic-spindle organizing protein 1 [Nilaparvata lugens]|uniref:mitotic-spindle organizing protein 1 n=1 Tax=Nilaparvata lugens TaxID=108931 RepID=UPI000B995E34|nr:mitotic-spindle organizing protein 1 [Nilaparvata lugens]
MCDNESSAKKNNDARETFSAIMEISNLLNTGLDAETLTYCVRLCENGVHPEALATVIKEMKREVESIKHNQENGLDRGKKDNRNM